MMFFLILDVFDRRAFLPDREGERSIAVLPVSKMGKHRIPLDPAGASYFDVLHEIGQTVSCLPTPVDENSDRQGALKKLSNVQLSESLGLMLFEAQRRLDGSHRVGISFWRFSTTLLISAKACLACRR